MGAADGSVAGTTKVVDHGADSERYVVAVLGDGFRSDQQAAFDAAVSSFTDALQFTKPFDDAWELLNVYKVSIHSVETGADNPATCGTGGPPAGGVTTARTYLDARFCGDNNIRRLLVVDSALATTTANAHVPDWDIIIVIVNHEEYGGSGGNNVAVYSLAPGALEIAIHELGHAAYGLADEYEYYQGCSSGETGHDTYSGGEPDEPNVTAVSDRATVKWRHLIHSATPVPTTTNANCTQCGTQPNPVDDDAIGVFTGAQYFHCGKYRPAYNCLMRTVGQGRPFCKVCQEAIKLKIASVVYPSCFVATAVYGNPLHEDVVWLRRWRNGHLAPGARWRRAMQLLVAAYERVGPPLAAATARRPRLAAFLRTRLFTPAVATLRQRFGPQPPPPSSGTR